MLCVGRLDAVLGYKDEIESIRKKMGDNTTFIVREGVVATPTFLVFAETEKGRQLSQHYNHEVIKLYRSGELKQLMYKHLGSVKLFPAEHKFFVKH